MAISDTMSADSHLAVTGCSPAVPHVSPDTSRGDAPKKKYRCSFRCSQNGAEAVAVVVVGSGHGRPQPVAESALIDASLDCRF